jgi:acetyl-CoA carboxylase carboxyltransferase component
VLNFVWAGHKLQKFGPNRSLFLKSKGEVVDEAEAELFAKKARYDEQVSPYYAASRLWTDAIIDPLDTRTWISMGIEAANHSLLKRNLI